MTVREGPGPALVLLHGLAGSSASWMRLAPLLPTFRLVIPDLLGFGRSPKPDSPYDLAAHCAALAPVIAETRPVAVIGHSMGGVIALALLQRHPEIGTGVLICPALYESREQAVAVIEHAPWLQRMSLQSPRMARIACEASCMLRPVLRPLAPLFASDLPVPVARAGLDHMWTSYSRSLNRVVLGGLGRLLVKGVGGRVTLVHASGDTTVPRQVLDPYAALVGRFVVVEGGHEVLLTRPEAIAHEVATSVAASGGASM